MAERLRLYHKALGPMGNNCFAIMDWQTGMCAVIDPGLDAVSVLDLLPPDASVDSILLTHGHFDHLIGIAAVVKETGAKILMHSADEESLRNAPKIATAFGMSCPAPPSPDILLDGHSEICVGNLHLEVRHTPGHSPGSVTFVVDGIAFVGDALFSGSIGRTDLPGGDHAVLLESIRTQLLTLPDATKVLPGHGPFTTIERERLTNPFLI